MQQTMHSIKIVVISDCYCFWCLIQRNYKLYLTLLLMCKTFAHYYDWVKHNLFTPLFFLFSFSPSLTLSFSLVHMCDKPFIPPRTFFSSTRPSSQITHSTHNGVCSYRLSTERPRTYICSGVLQTINNSRLMFKSNFSNKVLTIKRNKLRSSRRSCHSHSGDAGKSFSQSFFATSRFLWASHYLRKEVN